MLAGLSNEPARGTLGTAIGQLMVHCNLRGVCEDLYCVRTFHNWLVEQVSLQAALAVLEPELCAYVDFVPAISNTFL
jgi:hypothetical protein